MRNNISNVDKISNFIAYGIIFFDNKYLVQSINNNISPNTPRLSTNQSLHELS